MLPPTPGGIPAGVLTWNELLTCRKAADEAAAARTYNPSRIAIPGSHCTSQLKVFPLQLTDRRAGAHPRWFWWPCGH